MNEELNNRIKKLEQENAELMQWKKNMSASHSIPLENDQAFKGRFGFFTVSPKGANSEDVTVVSSVDFVGQTTVTTIVQNDPDVFLKIVAGGVVYHIPAFTS